MTIYRTIQYTSFNLDASFYAVVYNGRIAAYEIMGADLNVKGFQRVSYAEYIAIMEETKKRDGIGQKKTTTEKKRKTVYHKTAEKTMIDDVMAINKIIKENTKGNYKMTASEYAWNYLPL